MLARLLKSRRRSATPASSIPPGERVYAIGDVHGRLDLLDALIARIDADDRARASARTTIILLGDLVDRGPESAGVVARMRTLSAARPGLRFLLGNHEQIFLEALAGDAKALRLFCRVGGRETALSYGIAPDAYERCDYDELAGALHQAVPQADREFLSGFEDLIVIGDYAFVHAGVRPGRALADQSITDLRWIRDAFLDHGGPFEKVIVHGHTISEAAEILPFRIGIDTGAYASGRLTAIGLEGTDRWLLQVDESVRGEVETLFPAA